MTENPKRMNTPADTSLGAEIDRLYAFQDKYQEAQKKADELKKTLTEMKELLLARLDREKIPTASGSRGPVTARQQFVAQVENWDEFYAAIHKRKAYFLLQRRVANGAYLELMAGRRNKPFPGVVTRELRALALGK